MVSANHILGWDDNLLFLISKTSSKQAGWYMPVIFVFWRMKEEDSQFEANYVT